MYIYVMYDWFFVYHKLISVVSYFVEVLSLYFFWFGYFGEYSISRYKKDNKCKLKNFWNSKICIACNHFSNYCI